MTKLEYLLVCLAEEAAEIIKPAMKAARFGLGNHLPNQPELTNAQSISDELHDIMAIISLINNVQAGTDRATLIPTQLDYQKMTDKMLKVNKHMEDIGITA